MRIHLATQDLNLFGEAGQWHRITLRELFDTSGQRLGDAVQFGLHVKRKGSQPFIFHHQRLYFISLSILYLEATLASRAFCASLTFLLASVSCSSRLRYAFSIVRSSSVSGSAKMSFRRTFILSLGILT